jgi:hypothetical protein
LPRQIPEYNRLFLEKAKRKGMNRIVLFRTSRSVGLKRLCVCGHVAERALRGSCGIEEAGRLLVLDCSYKHSLRDACDEVTDVIGSDEWWQGIFESLDGLGIGGVLILPSCEGGCISPFEGFAATG